MSDDAPRTRRERLEAREEAIVSAAHAEFTEHGHAGTRMAEIARRAEVAEGTLYLYFRNKDALLEAVLGRFYGELTAGAEAGVARLGDTFERLTFLARHHLLQCMREWRILELMAALYRRISDYEDSGFRTLNRRYVAVFDQVLGEGMRRGELRADLSPRFQRDLFYGSLEYSVRTLKIHGGGEGDVDGIVAELIGILRLGAAPRPASSPPDEHAPLAAVTARLERLADRLEHQVSPDRSPD